MREKPTHVIRRFRITLLTATIIWFALPMMAQSGNFPGNPVSALVIDPAAPATLYVASSPGVYKSTNGGATWVGITSTRVLSLAIDPHATSTVYTENAKSTDGGATWSPLGLPAGGGALLVVDPQTPSTLYLAGGRTASKSTDAGVTWSDISPDLRYSLISHGQLIVNYARFESLAIDPQNSTLFGGFTVEDLASGIPAFPPFAGIARRGATDTSWREVASISNLSFSSNPHVLGFAIDPSDSSIIYAAAVTNPTGSRRGVLKSVDGGSTWNSSNTGFPSPPDATAIAIDPVNTSNVYVGTNLGIHKSINGGSSWTPSSGGFPNGAPIRVLAVDPQTPSTIYAGTALGVYKSTDAGASWIATNSGLGSATSGTPPILSNINPAGAPRDSIVTVTITGSSFVAPFGIDMGGGIALRDLTLTGSTSITATLEVASAAMVGTRNLVVTTSNGISNTAPFAITAGSQAPTLSAISPSTLNQNRNHTITLTGTNFTPSLAVDAGSAIAVNSLTVTSTTSATAVLSVAANAVTGPRNLTVSTLFGGSSNPSPVTVIPGGPTLTGISPSFILAGKPTAVRVTGTFLVSPLTFNTDADIAVYDVVPDPSGTSVTALFTAAQGAVLGPHTFRVTTPGGQSANVFGGAAPFLVKSLTRQSDFNGDGNADLLWYYPPTGETVMWLMNGTNVLSYASLLRDSDWKVTATGDFNGDGKADLLWYNARTGQTSMWLMNGTTGVSSAVLFTDPYWKVTSTGDFNGDGKTDLVWSHASLGRTSTWWMNGITRLSFFELPGSPNFQVTAIGDFNAASFNSGFDDVVGYNPATGETTAWFTLGPGVWTSRSLNTDPNWRTTALPDLDGDGNSDMLWYNATTGQTNGWLFNGGTQPIDTPLLTDPDWKVIATGDIDGDLKSDLIWYNAVTGQTVGWLMNGTTISNWAVLPATPGWKVTSTGDFNGDGKIDLVWTNAAAGQTVLWLMNGLAPSSSSLLLTDPDWRTISPGK